MKFGRSAIIPPKKNTASKDTQEIRDQIGALKVSEILTIDPLTSTERIQLSAKEKGQKVARFYYRVTQAKKVFSLARYQVAIREYVIYVRRTL